MEALPPKGQRKGVVLQGTYAVLAFVLATGLERVVDRCADAMKGREAQTERADGNLMDYQKYIEQQMRRDEALRQAFMRCCYGNVLAEFDTHRVEALPELDLDELAMENGWDPKED